MKFSKFNLILPYDGNKILFNTLTGYCVDIENEVANIIDNNQINSLAPKLVKDFINLGIIVEDSVDENLVVKYYHDREKYSSNMLLSTVLLTWGCNLKCVYCVEGSDHNFHNIIFGLSTLRQTTF